MVAVVRWAGGVCAAGLFACAAAGQVPKAPEGPLVVPTLPDISPPPAAAVAVTPVSLSTAPVGSPFREKQVTIAAYIGTEAVITEDEVWQMVRQRPDMRQVLQLAGTDRNVKERELFDDELKRLIDRELVIVEMLARLRKNKKEDLIRLIQEDAAKQATQRLTAYRKANKFATEEEFVKVLQAQGMTYKGIRRQLERDSISTMFLEQQVRDKVKQTTLADLWDYYQAHPTEFAVEDQLKWQDLFVSFARFPTPAAAKTYADPLWAQAAAGADFPALVAKFGQGDSNLRGGEGVGTKKGEIQPAELEATLLAMDAGQVSPLLQTATGYHIVKVVEREKAGTRPFDQKVQMECREKLARQVQKVELDRMTDELWRKYRPKVVRE